MQQRGAAAVRRGRAPLEIRTRDAVGTTTVEFAPGVEKGHERRSEFLAHATDGHRGAGVDRRKTRPSRTRQDREAATFIIKERSLDAAAQRLGKLLAAL